MKPYLLALTLGLSLLAATAQDRASKINPTPPKGDYYSWQHPEWPPLPGPIGSNLPTYRLSQTNLPATTNYLVDDREVDYRRHLTESEQREQANDAELSRFPDFVARVNASAQSRPEDAALGERAQRLNAAMKTNPPAPYSFTEYGRMKAFIVAGAMAKTNAQAVLHGVHISLGDGRDGGLFGGGYFACGTNRLARISRVAQRALASTNRADTDEFYAELNK